MTTSGFIMMKKMAVYLIKCLNVIAAGLIRKHLRNTYATHHFSLDCIVAYQKIANDGYSKAVVAIFCSEKGSRCFQIEFSLFLPLMFRGIFISSFLRWS